MAQGAQAQALGSDPCCPEPPRVDVPGQAEGGHARTPDTSQAGGIGTGDANARGARREDLLRASQARVAVSSAVRSEEIFPAFLVDGDPATSWQSQTGDLEGAWIEFEVPAADHVWAIELVVGDLRTLGLRDAFTANHRVRRVEVLRNGQRFGMFIFDPNRRRFQTIPINAPGGRYRIVVHETVAGSEARFREVAIGELRVIGDTRAAGRAHRAPIVSVGGLNHLSRADVAVNTTGSTEELRLLPSLHALCAYALEQAEKQSPDPVTHGHYPLKPSCSDHPLAVRFRPSKLFMAVRELRTTGRWGSRRQLAAQLPRGWVALPVYWLSSYEGDPGCPGIFRAARLSAVKVQNGHLLAELYGPSSIYYDGGEARTLYQSGAIWCEPGERSLSCRAYGNRSGLGSFRSDVMVVAPDGSLRIQGRGIEE